MTRDCLTWGFGCKWGAKRRFAVSPLTSQLQIGRIPAWFSGRLIQGPLIHAGGWRVMMIGISRALTLLAPPRWPVPMLRPDPAAARRGRQRAGAGRRCGRDSPWKVAVGLSSAHRHFSLPHKAGPHHDGRMADSLSGDSRPARGCGRRGNPETGAKPGSNSICDCFSATFAGFTREFMAHEGHANASSRAGEQ